MSSLLLQKAAAANHCCFLGYVTCRLCKKQVFLQRCDNTVEGESIHHEFQIDEAVKMPKRNIGWLEPEFCPNGCASTEVPIPERWASIMRHPGEIGTVLGIGPQDGAQAAPTAQELGHQSAQVLLQRGRQAGNFEAIDVSSHEISPELLAAARKTSGH